LTNGLTIAGTLTTSNLTTVGTVTLTGGINASGKVTSYARAVATGASTTGYMVQNGTFSGSAQLDATTVTQTFATVFDGKPFVVVVNSNSNTYITNTVAAIVSSNQFTYTPNPAGTGTVFTWFAAGAKLN